MSLGARLRRVILWLALFFGAAAVVFAILAAPQYLLVRQEMAELTEAHRAHEVAHPGWSFPGRVWSAPASMDLPSKVLMEHARIRQYTERCPPADPGEYCPKTGEIIPRGGLFPEGVQPPGTAGWTRPLALEPIRIGTLLGPDGEIRWHLPVAEAPKLLVDAILAAEDLEYYEHHGVNLSAAARAAWINLRGGGYRQGASTLTMQMVRMLSQRREKTIGRKLREMASAFALDSYAGKDGVLQMYLDSPYLGQAGNQSICGFKAAAWYYYGLQPDELDLSQAATLAGILPAPGRFAPDRHPEEARVRRDMVLERMKRLGYDVTAALAEPVTATPHGLPEDRYPAWLQATRIWLEANLPPEVVYGAGLDVFTALDVVAQERTDTVMPEKVRFLEGIIGKKPAGPLQAASALIDTEAGTLVAVYGGDLSLPTDFNRATQARRQPGSAFKPLVYALAFNTPGPDGHPKYTAAHAVPNAPREFAGTGGWKPRNVGGEYSSTTCLANGLAWSQNIATASLLEELGGPKPLIALAGRFGIDTKSFPEEMGIALGQAEVTPLEMARFVGTVANRGLFTDGSPVLLIRDGAGAVRYEHKAPSERVLSEEAAALTRDLMRLVIEFGTGGASRGAGGYAGYPGPSIGKTGTTDSEKDLWFIGATPRYAGAVWLGYDQPQRIGWAASDLAAPLWGWWMRAMHEGFKLDAEFTGLELAHRGVCKVTGKLPNGSCPIVPAPFIPGTVPKQGCGMEHPPPEPEPASDEELGAEPAEGEATEGAPGEEKPKPQKHESLWKKRAREAEEKAAAEGAAPPAP